MSVATAVNLTGQEKGTRAQPTLTEAMQTIIDIEGWHLTQTPNHWSSQETMREYIIQVVDRWVTGRTKELLAEENKKKSGVVHNGHAVLLFDCWSVHKSDEFLNWLKTTHPQYHVVFVPAGCTGKAQPADVVLQRPLKHQFGLLYTMYTTQEIMLQLKVGAKPEEITVDKE